MSDTRSELPIEIDVHAVHALLAQEDCLLLDCREPAEVKVVSLEKATHIPMGEIPGRLKELEGYFDRRIVVYCHHGERSRHVTQFLRSRGYTQVQNMAGGIDQWSCEIDRSKPRY